MNEADPLSTATPSSSEAPRAAEPAATDNPYTP